MKKEQDPGSVEKLQDAMGMIKDEYIEEAARPGGNRWKRPTRIAAIIVAAACVVLLVSLAILRPGGNNTAQQAEVDMNVNMDEEMEMGAESLANMYEAAAEAAEEAVAETTTAKAETDGTVLQILEVPDAEMSRILSDRGQLEELLNDHQASDPALSEALLSRYDAAFFETHSLALSVLELSSGAYQPEYLRTEENGSKAVQHYCVYRPDKDPKKEGAFVTADMAYWMLFSEVSKDVTEVTAQEEDYPYGS